MALSMFYQKLKYKIKKTPYINELNELINSYEGKPIYHELIEGGFHKWSGDFVNLAEKINRDLHISDAAKFTKDIKKLLSIKFRQQYLIGYKLFSEQLDKKLSNLLIDDDITWCFDGPCTC